MEMDIVKLLTDTAENIYENGIETKRSMDEVKEWDSVEEALENIEAILNYLTYVAKAIKMAAGQLIDTISNEQRLEAAVEMVKKHLSFPAWVEFAGGMLLRWAISAAYQAYVKGK